MMIPPVFDSAAAILSRYDVIFCDVWGVLHDGVVAHPKAADALSAFRRNGGRVVLISNAPSRGAEVEALLDAKRISRSAWDAIVTSGDLTRFRIEETGIRRVFHIGTPRAEHVFEGLDVELVDLETADAVVATELMDYYSEAPEDYRPLLEAAAARRLPFICGNPDLVVHVGEDLLPCAGALAVIFEELGGEVYWAGKPYAPVYERARQLAGGLGGDNPALSRILAIGDALRTDIAGAMAFGIDALLIAGGIHRDEILRDDAIDEGLLAEFAGPHAPGLIGVMKALA
ncbi:TIGR01459 family HAD-type hydrolase [Microvirga antarctica]|uniref:TIGR01459 family HAD-type hydrolase n=1 Tax=Microvirga antarctica TaxID=2819233 RepID=UPI001B30CF7A|nr:TIGR01459 family HAD-type hydrolase [Microvirga antarctica]